MNTPWHPPRTRYDPRRDGADCDNCPMRRWHGSKWAPVPAKVAAAGPTAERGKVVAIGGYPGHIEEKRREPFVGKAGIELNRALGAVKLARARLTIDNVIACRPPETRSKGGDAYKAIGGRLKRDKDAGDSGPAEQHPVKHCAGRVQRTLAKASAIIPMGSEALSAVIGGNAKIMNHVGGPIRMRRLATGALIREPEPDLDEWGAPKALLPEVQALLARPLVRVLPTFNPAYVARKRRERALFDASLRRAVRFFTDTLEWAEPYVVSYRPSPSVVETFLACKSDLWTYDLETDDKYPLATRIRCVAITRDATPEEQAQGHPDATIVVPLLSMDGVKRFYPMDVLRRILALLRKAMTDGRLWAGWNAGWFDRLVMETRAGFSPKPLVDGIVLQALDESEEGKSLGRCAAKHTDSPSWKVDAEGKKTATGAKSDPILWKYGGGDTTNNHRLMPILRRRAAAHGAFDPCPARPSMNLARLLHRLQEVACGLTTVGLPIDTTLQPKIEREQDILLGELRAKVCALAPPALKGHNPNSPIQVAEALYGRQGFGLEPVEYTETDQPSTGAPCVREHLMDPTTPKEARDYLFGLLEYKGASTLQSSFIRKLKPKALGGGVTMHPWGGRLHLAWNAHIPVTTRFSSSDPMNGQNWPKAIRKLVCAPPGHVLVSADYDALEAKGGAAEFGMTMYLDAYKDIEYDAHQLTMELVFGKVIWTLGGAPPAAFRYRKEWPAHFDAATGQHVPAGKLSGKFNEYRQQAKRWYYGAQYGAGDETVWLLMREATDDEGRFINANLRVVEVSAMTERFHRQCPEMRQGWDRARKDFERDGYLAERITGRRRYFRDGFDPCEIANFRIQAGGAGLMNLATLDVWDAGFTPGYAGPGTGIIQQGHDALMLCVPERDEGRAKDTLHSAMNVYHPSIYDVRITAAAESGQRWSDV